MEQFNYSFNKLSNSLSLKQYVYKIGSYHYNWHNYLELLVIINGEVEVCTNGKSRVLKSDDVILINSNMGHATLAHEPDSIAMLLHIDPLFFKDYYEEIEFLFFNLCSTEETRNSIPFRLIRSYLSEMLLSCIRNGPEQRLFFESTFYSLMYTIILYFPPESIKSRVFKSNQKKFAAIERMIKYINKSYKKKITLERLANDSGYNSNYVSQLFKANLGINFYDYLTRIRLREATRELSQTNHKILDIALENGFPDIKAFDSVFKENFGKSPTEYRRRLSSENIRNDINFKKQFISVSNELVNKKLVEYIVRKDSETEGIIEKGTLTKEQKLSQAVNKASKISVTLKSLEDELKGSIRDIESLTEDLSN